MKLEGSVETSARQGCLSLVPRRRPTGPMSVWRFSFQRSAEVAHVVCICNLRERWFGRSIARLRPASQYDASLEA
jgi:hypothetical protein